MSGTVRASPGIPGPVPSSGALARREQEVLPRHGRAPGGVHRTVAAGEVRQLGVERGGAVLVGGDAAVGRDGRPVAGLEVVPEVLGPAEEVDADALTARPYVGDLITEERAEVILAAPQRRRLGTGRGRRRVRPHGGEHLADEALRGPAEQA